MKVSQKDNLLEERKKELLQKSESYELAIKDQLMEAKQEVIRGVKVAVAIGVFSLGAYFILRKVFGVDISREELLSGKASEENADKDKTLETRYNEDNSIFGSVKREIALFLVSIAKQKLLEFITRLTEDMEEEEYEEEEEFEEFEEEDDAD